MKQIFIIRHSRASETSPDNSDFNRCLAPYGVNKATRISEYLTSKVPHVDLILTSPACRAFETAQIFARAFNYPEEKIMGQAPLYHFGGIEQAMEVISRIDDAVNTVMIFGHNPTFNALAWRLCPEFRSSMPTSCVVGIDLKIKSWGNIEKAKGKLIIYVTKKQIQPF